MFQARNFVDNDNIETKQQLGGFRIIEYKRDLSVTPSTATAIYFCNMMNIHKRQLVIDMSMSKGAVIQAGAMQWMLGDVSATTGIKGVGDFLGKVVKGSVTKESAIKPEYVGTGLLVLEPTYRYLALMDMSEWEGGVVLDDGLFLACENTIKNGVVMRSNLSSAVAGGEGLFNLTLEGSGVFCIESFVPREELVEIELQNDVVKIDGNLAIAWSKSLEFTVERAGKTLIGSAASGEGLVNVYRGTGKVLMAPVQAAKG